MPGPIGLRQSPDYLLRVGYVKQSWDLMAVKYGPEAILKQTGEDFSRLVNGFLPGLLLPLGGLIVTSLAGATIGGMLGALAGGAGTIPGAMAGGEAGFSVGLWILEWLGLGFLAVYLGSALSEVTKHFAKGALMAWNSGGTRVLIHASAAEMAEGLGRFFSLLLQALVALFLKEGLESAEKTLTQSKIGQRFAAFLEDKAFKKAVAETMKKANRIEDWQTIIARLNLETAPNGGALWSKVGPETAAQLAANSKLKGFAANRMTLETVLKKEKDFLELYKAVFGESQTSLTRAIWEDLSRRYVRGLKGNVDVYVDDPVLLASIQKGQSPVLAEELDIATEIMQMNGQISSITFRDASGRYSKMLTRRQISLLDH